MLGVAVKLVNYTEEAPKIIALSSKVSLTRKTIQQLLEIREDEVETWIKETFKRQHFSPWEHASYTFLIDGLSRIASHQLVRHRHASYTQMSHRYTEGYLRTLALEAAKLSNNKCPEKPSGNKREAYTCYSKTITEATKTLNNTEQLAKLASIAFVPPIPFTGRAELLKTWAETTLQTTSTYYNLLARGARKEDARYVLADSVRTRIVVTMNARELVQVFLPLRTCTKAQWEIRYIAWKIWEELHKIHPQLYRWAGPSCVFKENTTRKEPAELRDFIEGREAFTIPRCPELVEGRAIPACLKTAFGTLKIQDLAF